MGLPNLKNVGMMYKMDSIIDTIPNIHMNPLKYVLQHAKPKDTKDTLWLEFGVASGRTINYISEFTKNNVYGFDSFEGLPERWREGFEKGAFGRNGTLPDVNKNVVLIKGWFHDTLPEFVQNEIIKTGKKVSFIHVDCDLYSSTKCIFETLKCHLSDDCLIVFDELVNYPGYDGNTGELKAFYEFITENDVEWEWIGMNGTPRGMMGYQHENAAVRIKQIKNVATNFL